MSTKLTGINWVDQLPNSFSTFKSLIFYLVHEDFFVPKHFRLKIDREYRCYELNFLQRVFVTLTDAGSSKFSLLVNILLIFAIGLSVYATLMGDFYRDFDNIPATCDTPVCDNDPKLCPGKMICEPFDDQYVTVLNAFCNYLFTIEFGIRIFIAPFMPTRLTDLYKNTWMLYEEQQAKLSGRDVKPEPYHTPTAQFFLYIISPTSIIDAVSVVPSWFAQSNFAFVRVLRTFKLFKILKALNYGGVLDLCADAMHKSSKLLVFLFVTEATATLFFGFLIFFVEGGDFIVSADYPTGKYVRLNPFKDLGTEESPYETIFPCFYWAVVTLTTGD